MSTATCLRRGSWITSRWTWRENLPAKASAAGVPRPNHSTSAYHPKNVVRRHPGAVNATQSSTWRRPLPCPTCRKLCPGMMGLPERLATTAQTCLCKTVFKLKRSDEDRWRLILILAHWTLHCHPSIQLSGWLIQYRYLIRNLLKPICAYKRKWEISEENLPFYSVLFIWYLVWSSLAKSAVFTANTICWICGYLYRSIESHVCFCTYVWLYARLQRRETSVFSGSSHCHTVLANSNSQTHLLSRILLLLSFTCINVIFLFKYWASSQKM